MSYPRRAADAYHTIDPLAVRTLARGFALHGRDVWEPCAGRGELVRQLEHHGATVTATELHSYPDQDPRITTGLDFLRIGTAWAPHIVMNPPYAEARLFIAHALHLIWDGYVAVLLRHDWICRKSEIFRSRLHAYIPIRGRLKWIEGPAVNGPRHNFAWLIYGPATSRPQDSPEARLIL